MNLVPRPPTTAERIEAATEGREVQILVRQGKIYASYIKKNGKGLYGRWSGAVAVDSFEALARFLEKENDQ